MTSKITKAIASRIPVDLYSELINEAEKLEINMNDYLLKIIKERHEKQPTSEPIDPPKPKKEKVPSLPKPVKKKKTQDTNIIQGDLFSEI
jgi:hypothetical protein